MKRRTFLLSAGIAACAAVLPTSVFAKPYVHIDSGMPIAKLELIEQALDAGTKLGFDPTQQTELFGFNPFTPKDTAELRDKLYEFTIEYRGIDFWNRMRYVIAIREQIDKHFPFADHSNVLDSTRSDSEYTYREQMLFDQMALLHVAKDLGSNVTGHGFKEMRAYG